MNKRLLSMLLVAIMLVGAAMPTYAAKKKDEDWYEEWGSQRITLSENSIILYADGEDDEQEFQLEAELDPNDEDLTWESYDKNIATVDKNGLVKARREGKTTIKVTGKESERSATCKVEVRKEPVPVTEAKVTKDGYVVVTKGKEVKLPMSLKPSDHTEVEFFSQVDDTDICSVDRKGYVRGREAGSTDVTVWFKNVEKGEEKTGSIDKDEADFVLHYEVEVLDYDLDVYNDFNEDFEGFRRGKTTDVDQFKWVEIVNVGWILYDASQGQYVDGWETVGGKRYFLPKTNISVEDAKGKKHTARVGLMQTGWVQDNGHWFLLNASGAMVKGWGTSDGKWYYLDPVNGEMRTGIQQISNKYYYLRDDGSAVEGWWTNPKDNKMYYGNPGTCELPTQWFLVEGIWYYADMNGFYTYTNKWIKESDGSQYYVDGTGKMLVNTTTPDGFAVGIDGKWIP